MSAPTDTPTPTPAPTPAPAPNGGADWGALVSSLPEGIRAAPSIAGSKSFGDFAQRFMNLEQVLGTKRVEAPQDGWTPEKWNDFYTQIGRPEKPEGYDFKGIDFSKVPEFEPLISKFREVFHAKGLRPEQAHGIAQAYTELVAGQYAEAQALIEKALADSKSKLQAEWGGDYEKNLAAANESAKKIFTPEEFTAFQQIRIQGGGMLGDSPLMVKLLKYLHEATPPEGGHGAGRGATAMTPDAARDRYDAFMADPQNQEALYNNEHPRHDAAVAERMELRRRMTPENPEYGPQL